MARLGIKTSCTYHSILKKMHNAVGHLVCRYTNERMNLHTIFRQSGILMQ